MAPPKEQPLYLKTAENDLIGFVYQSPNIFIAKNDLHDR